MTNRSHQLILGIGLALLGCSQENSAAPGTQGTGGSPTGVGASGPMPVGTAGSSPAAGAAPSTGATAGMGSGAPAGAPASSGGTGGAAPTAGSATIGGGGTAGAGGTVPSAGTDSGGGAAVSNTSGGGGVGNAGSGGGGAGAAAAGSGGEAGMGSSGEAGTGSSGEAGMGGEGGAAAGGGAGMAGDSSAGGTPPAQPFSGSYHMGADITWVQHDEANGATYVDTDGVAKDILELMKNHGFNSVRLRSYVDPMASDGYDQVDGFGDLAHTVTMAKRVKDAGMGLLISFHLSDNWADPGKQCIPVAWQGDSFNQLTQHVHDYMFDAITALKDAGATPELVQVGNEITPGTLIHICDSDGHPTSTNSVNGSTSNWSNLGTLLKAGISGVKEVDGNIKTVLHIDKGGDVNTSVSWIQNALDQGVDFDVFADTCYVRWQGQPDDWQNTFDTLTSRFPDLMFIIPEHANESASRPSSPSTMRLANDIVFNIPNNRGLGAWFYEPEHPVQAGVGTGLFINDTSGGDLADAWPAFELDPDAIGDYDQMRTAYQSRL